LESFRTQDWQLLGNYGEPIYGASSQPSNWPKRKDIIKSLWSLTQRSLLILLLRDLITFALLLFFASITLRCRRGRSSSNIPINRQTKLLTDLQVNFYFYLRVFMFLILLRQVALTFYGRIVLEFILTEKFMCSLV
jgi:hypothetical protein